VWINKAVEELSEEVIEDESMLEIKEWFDEICGDRK
jgi:hypothetical protein